MNDRLKAAMFWAESCIVSADMVPFDATRLEREFAKELRLGVLDLQEQLKKATEHKQERFIGRGEELMKELVEIPTKAKDTAMDWAANPNELEDGESWLPGFIVTQAKALHSTVVDVRVKLKTALAHLEIMNEAEGNYQCCAERIHKDREEAERDRAKFDQLYQDSEKARLVLIEELKEQKERCMKHEGHLHCVTPCDSIRIQEENHSSWQLEKERADKLQRNYDECMRALDDIGRGGISYARQLSMKIDELKQEGPCGMCFWVLKEPCTEHAANPKAPKKDPEIEWIVNDIAELGVKIGDRFAFLYKGYSYQCDGKWRPVFKREFGETCHPWTSIELHEYKDVQQRPNVRLPKVFMGYFGEDLSDWKDLPKTRD